MIKYYSNIKSKPIITPKLFLDNYINNAKNFKVSKNILIFFSEENLFGFIKKNSSKHKFRRVKIFDKWFCLYESAGKQDLSIAYIGFGAPIVSFLIEILISLGAKRIITIGSACSINDKLKEGDIILISKSYSSDCVLSHYNTKQEEESDPILRNNIMKVLDRNSIDFLIGTSYTTDAIFRETSHLVDNLRRRDISIIEMEAKVLFDIAKQKKVKIASLAYISDCIKGDKWIPSSGYFKDARQSIFDCAPNFFKYAQ